jgi:hypothetical protein
MLLRGSVRRVSNHYIDISRTSNLSFLLDLDLYCYFQEGLKTIVDIGILSDFHVVKPISKELFGTY